MTAPIPIDLLLSLQAILLLLSIALLVRILGKAKRTKHLQDRLVESLGRNAADAWFRINLSRPAHFAKRLKLIGFEAKGLLVNSPDHIRILAEFDSGERIDRSVKKRDLGLRWIGNTGIASSNMHWIAVGPGDRPLYLSADTGFNALQSREATADICRIIDPQFRLPTVATNEFALEKNPGSLTVVAVLFLLLAFAFLDGIVLNHNQLLEFSWLTWTTPVSASLAVPAYWWLTRLRVPSRESMTLTLLLGLAITTAYIPALKRADQFLSESGPTPFSYRLGPGAVLEPIAPGPPKVNYSRSKEYWEQFDEGSTHDFDLIHGPLGLWQLDHTKLDEKFHDFYAASGKGRRGGP